MEIEQLPTKWILSVTADEILQKFVKKKAEVDYMIISGNNTIRIRFK